jgi:TOTE conflict system, Archaeo-Eukaryotic Primase domain
MRRHRNIATTTQRRKRLTRAALTPAALRTDRAMSVDDVEQAIATAEVELADLDARRASVADRLAVLEAQRGHCLMRRPTARLERRVDAVEEGRAVPVAIPKAARTSSPCAGRTPLSSAPATRRAARTSGSAASARRRASAAALARTRRCCPPPPPPCSLILQGRHVVGIYLLLADDTCWLLAIDLDGDSWREDVRALRQAARELGLEPAVERSRSGGGAHLWLFFDRPAADARAHGDARRTTLLHSSQREHLVVVDGRPAVRGTRASRRRGGGRGKRIDSRDARTARSGSAPQDREIRWAQHEQVPCAGATQMLNLSSAGASEAVGRLPLMD